MALAYFPAWPKRIAFERDYRPALAQALRRIGAERPFILASNTLVGQGALAELRPPEACIYSGVPQHSPQDAIIEAARAAREWGADCVVSIGGGSVIDAAKVLQLVLASGIDSCDQLATWKNSREASPTARVPHIAVPTTLSCADLTYFAGARNADTGLKQSFAAPWLVADTIIYGAELAMLTPPRLWLSSGIRAVDHAVEAIFARDSNPIALSLCRDGLARMLAALDRCAEGADADVYGEAQLAAWTCGVGLMSAVPMGASHAFGHVIGSLFGGEPAAALRNRIAGLDLPTRLRDVGIAADKFGAIATGLGEESWLASNPRPIVGPGDIEAILKMAA